MILKDFLEKIKYKNSFGFLVAFIFRSIYVFFKYRIFSDQFYISKRFKLALGYELDLSQPKTLNEKIQWYKVNYKNPFIEQCADKYAVREYVSEAIGEKYLIPLIFHTKDYKEIKPNNLPNYPFIIKANHTAGTNHIVKEKSNVDWKKIQTDCRWWLKLNYYYMQKEWQYRNIKPQIVVEKLLMDSKGNIPLDYKLHYFNGKFEFLQVDIDRFIVHKRNLYDKNWKLLPFSWSEVDDSGKAIWDKGRDIEKPKNLKELIELGEKLAAPFPYVRVDFYILNEKIFFGELTFHHGGGYEQFTPDKWDLYFGNKVPLIKKF
jgi:hypothetical protein